MNVPKIFDKPFKTYEELIDIISDRHIIVSDKEFAIHALQNFSYYGIVNGYKNTFLQIPGTDDFIEGTKFEDLYTLQLIDTSLNNVLFKYILLLEKSLKSRLSYLVSKKYGVFTDWEDMSCSKEKDYLCKKYYSNSSGHRINILKKLKENISSASRNPSMIHYMTDKNHIPAWILTTNIPYGLTIQWYSILRNDDKEAICDTFISPGLCAPEKTKEFVKKALEITKEYRNKIAHGNRTFSCIDLPQLPKEQVLAFTFNAISEQEYNQHMGQNDTMAVILALMVMLNDQNVVYNLYTDILNLLSPHSSEVFNNKSVFEVFGFPENLFERLLQLAKTKFQ